MNDARREVRRARTTRTDRGFLAAACRHFTQKNNCKGSRSAHTLNKDRNPTEHFQVMNTTEAPDVLLDTIEAANRMGIAPATLVDAIKAWEKTPVPERMTQPKPSRNAQPKYGPDDDIPF